MAMRKEPRVMNSVPQIETAEMTDADLENVSAGLGLGGSGGLVLETPLGDVIGSLAAAVTPQGASAGAAVHTMSI
jgi:hypothetical protein